MPVVVPGQPGVFLINDLIPEVIIRVENRTNDTARASQWLVDALLEISGNPDYRDEFCELEVLGQTYSLTTGQQEYAETLLLPSAIQNQTPINMATLDVLLWTDYPANVNRRRLDWTNFQDTDRFQVGVTSLPHKAYRFNGNIGFYPVPNKPYQVQSRVLIYHPINWLAPPQTTIMLPIDWLEILKLAAAQRGFLELEEFEKATAIHNLLYGDPKYPGNTGLMNGRKKKRMKEMWRTEAPLRPTVRSYSYARR